MQILSIHKTQCMAIYGFTQVRKRNSSHQPPLLSHRINISLPPHHQSKRLLYYQRSGHNPHSTHWHLQSRRGGNPSGMSICSTRIINIQHHSTTNVDHHTTSYRRTHFLITMLQSYAVSG